MAKTLMIANDIYNDLKTVKGTRSFSKLLRELLELKKNKGRGLLEVAGLLEGDREYEEVMKLAKKGWSTWTEH